MTMPTLPDHESHRNGKPPRVRVAHRVKGRLGLSPCAVAGISLTNYNVGPDGKGWGAHCTGSHTTVTLSNGVRGTCRSEIAELSTLVLNECIRRGYQIRQADTGCYNCRYISGTTVWSNHAWALAWDINWQTNPYTSAHITDQPQWMNDLFNRYGFANGADYTGAHDWMHHEFMGSPAQAVVATALARKELSGIVPAPTPPMTTYGTKPTMLPPWPLHVDEWFGLKTDPNPKSHGGMIPEDRPPLMHAQEWLHYKGWFGNVPYADVVDGDFGQRTFDAVAAWQGLVAPATIAWGAIWSDDWARLDD